MKPISDKWIEEYIHATANGKGRRHNSYRSISCWAMHQALKQIQRDRAAIRELKNSDGWVGGSMAYEIGKLYRTTLPEGEKK